MAINRSERLRKKMHFGEYTEYGFAARYVAKNKDAEADLFAQLAKIPYARGLSFLHDGNHNYYFYKTVSGSATEADRNAIEILLTNSNKVTSYKVESLSDGWHPCRIHRFQKRQRGKVLLVITPQADPL